jgi:CheY-like chemotaxis protein
LTRRASVLVAEDNQVSQRVVLGMLQKHGYDVVLAGNGREALERLGERAFDAVLMDIQMPELDGIETARRIRGEPRWKDLPIVAMTAHAMNGDRERCLEAGMNAYLSKPVSAGHLLEVLEEFTAGSVRRGGRPSEAAVELPSPIDGQVAARLMDNEMHLIHGMAQLFLQLAPERLHRLHSAAVRTDAATLRAQAQKLGQAAERIAAMEVARCAYAVAESAAGDYAVVQDRLFGLEREIRRLEQHVQHRPDAAAEPSAVPT